MGALAPITPWIPDDDLLLKSAIEDGASLESLAKGAVQFSRRFTIKEIHDRWRSLLYDPVIAAEASARMIECERSASKSSRTDNSKENKCVQAKRKGESVRRSYYAMRKRMCSEPLPGDLGLLDRPGGFISEGEAPGSSNMLGHPMGNQFALGDMHHVLSQGMKGDAPTCDVAEFPVGQKNTLGGPVEHSGIAMAGGCTGTKQINSSKELVGHGIFKENGIKQNPVCNSKDFICSDFGQNTIFNSPISDCGTSFHHLQYTSPSAMSDWKPIESIPVSGIPGGVSIGGNNVQNGDPFVVHCGGDSSKVASDYVVIPTGTKFDSHMSCDDLKNSTGCTEGFLDELSDTLFNFTQSDEEMLNTNGEKDAITKSFYDGLSLLLNSPNDVNADNMPNIPEKLEKVAPNSYPDIPSNTESKENKTSDTHLGDMNHQSETQAQSSAIFLDPHPEISDGIICCKLNTEDQDIPCNCDVVFPGKPQPSSTHRRTQNDANNLVIPGKADTSNRASGKGNGSTKKEPKRLGEPHPASQTQGPDIGLNQTVDEFEANIDISGGELQNGPRKLCSSYGGPCQSSLGVKKEPPDPLVVRPLGCVADKLGHVSNLGHLQACTVGISQQEPGGEPLLSDPDEQYSESDPEIPSFADIESMILDMDLEPDDQDSLSSKNVAKYQHEDHKRAIIRLEQNARSCMQRAIASRKAIAVFFGRHSTHFIKKDEVLLGRPTGGAVVDIDLSKEGHANKIPRQQAKIKMKKNGMFKLKNLSKYPIYVNDKKIDEGGKAELHSNCYIEVRGMPFIFETNQECINRYRKCV